MSYNFKRIFFSLFLLIGFVLPTLSQNTLQDGYYRIISKHNSLPIHVHNRQLGYVSEQAGKENGMDLSRVWKVKQVDGTYWIVNVGEALPIEQHGMLNVTFSVGYAPAHYYIKAASGDEGNGYYVISTNKDFSGRELWHNGGSGLVQNWEGVNSKQNFWKFQPLTDEEKKSVESFEQQWSKLETGFKHLETLRQGGLYRVKNAQGHYWQEDAKNHQLKTTSTKDKTDFSALWIVEANAMVLLCATHLRVVMSLLQMEKNPSQRL